MGLLTTNDFKEGFYKLPLDKFQTLKLADFLIEFDDDLFLGPLFGKDLYALYKADLAANVPQNPPFTTVFNKLCIEIDHRLCCHLPYSPGSLNKNCKELINTIGIKDMMRGFLYYEFLVNHNLQKTPMGNVMLDSANSNVATDSQNVSDAEARYNRSITTYQDLQKYMCATPADFPTFAGFPMFYKMEGIF